MKICLNKFFPNRTILSLIVFYISWIIFEVQFLAVESYSKLGPFLSLIVQSSDVLSWVVQRSVVLSLVVLVQSFKARSVNRGTNMEEFAKL